MAELFGTLGFLGVLAFFPLVIVMSISVYAAQKWTYKCYRELREIDGTSSGVLQSSTKDKRQSRRTNSITIETRPTGALNFLSLRAFGDRSSITRASTGQGRAIRGQTGGYRAE
jgi:hypothetical protein